MAYSIDNLSAAENARFTANKPVLFGDNALLKNGTAHWGNAVGDTTDRAATGYGSARLYDGYDHLVSKPSSAATQWWIKVNLASGETVDSIALKNIILGTITSITIRIADSQDLSVNPVEFVITHNTTEDYTTNTFDLINTKRVVFYNFLNGGNRCRINSLRYIGIKFTYSGTTVPQVGEVFVGQRRQLYNNPDVPWDANNLRSQIDTHESRTGVITKYARALNQRMLSARLTTNDTTLASALTSFHTQDIRGGRDNFWWSDTPYTNPFDSVLMSLDGNTLDYPYTGPIAREYNLDAVEVGPNFLANE